MKVKPTSPGDQVDVIDVPAVDQSRRDAAELPPTQHPISKRPSNRRIIELINGANPALCWDLVADLGRIRSRRNGREFFLDFRPYGRLWSNRGIRITDEATARRLLEKIRGQVADGTPLVEVLARYQPADAKANLVPTWVARWLEVKERQTESGDRSPTYLIELRRYAGTDGHFSWWKNHGIQDVSYGTLEDWSLWLADRSLSPKTRRNVIGAFRSFLGWLKQRGEIRDVPQAPLPRLPEYVPRVLSIEEQDLILEAIPDGARGIFLAMAHLGLRPGEARAADVSDYRDGWLTIDKAFKGTQGSAPIRGTKTGQAKRLPVGEWLAAWIAQHVDPTSRLLGGPLFVNPRTGRRWTHCVLRDQWIRAAESVGLEGVRLYEGTKHTMATDAVRRGVSERALQAFLGIAMRALRGAMRASRTRLW
jgi:integrase